MPLEKPQTVTHSPLIRHSMEKGDKVPELEGKALLHQTGFLPAVLQSWGILLLPSPGQLEP